VLTHSDKGPQDGLPAWDIGGYFNQNKDVKLPAELLSQAHGFFKWAFETHGTEAAVLITVDWNDQFHLFCPDQIVGGASVSYEVDVEMLPPDQVVVGSIHSHCDFSAFHSGTDTHDADKTDGLHITLGFVTRDIAESDVMFAFSGIKWTSWGIENILDGEQMPPGDFPEDWKSMLVRWTAPVPKQFQSDYRSAWGSDDDAIEAYLKWMRDGDEGPAPSRTGKVITTATTPRPTHNEAHLKLLRKYTLKAVDYAYGDKARSAVLLKSDLGILASLLKTEGITLTFDVKVGDPVSTPKAKAIAD
jgi:hypothetical protein